LHRGWFRDVMLFYTMYFKRLSHKLSVKIGRWFQTVCFDGKKIYIYTDETLKKNMKLPPIDIQRRRPFLMNCRLVIFSVQQLYS